MGAQVPARSLIQHGLPLSYILLLVVHPLQHGALPWAAGWISAPVGKMFLRFGLGVCSCKVVSKESCLEINGFCFQQFMAVLCPSYVSCLHSLSTCSSQLAALPLYVLLSLPWGCKIPSHFSSPGTGSDLFHFSYVVILTCGSRSCFFLLPLLPAIFQLGTDVPPPLELTTMRAQE